MTTRKKARTSHQKRQKKVRRSKTSTSKVYSKASFWTSIVRAADAIPKESTFIRGLSGIQHPIISAGIDDIRKRLIAISFEQDARSAALAQADIQAAFKSYQVVIARPVFLNTADLIRSLPTGADLYSVLSTYTNEKTHYATLLPSDRFKEWKDHELTRLSFQQILFHATFDRHTRQNEQLRAEVLAKLSRDPLESDRKLGTCAIPIYDFSLDEIETLLKATDLEHIKEILRQRDVLQYFFPPPDQLALGLIEQDYISKASELVEHIQMAPQIGHPLGASEITSATLSINKMIQELQERNLIVDGEVGIDLTPEGQSIRQTVRFKPREGLFSKLLNRFSINVNLKNMFGLGGDT